ncbi:polyprenyl synthetase family protein [Nitrosarchaeum sp. AC2]|uniref:polyprenyl synthetase family protein n=1 Tax=Nitrosarchaeum sp. AC2 TaxID=2259673 RepID=UPI0015C82390|nr:polyprenyl synthetase family protein [Nitrosarchaeum sp. AC2]QLH11788.1 polyprenyl synthetase family protein [Nitrosarchaeum sp. AC2]
MKKTSTIEKNAKIINRYLNSKIKGDPKMLYDAASHLIIHGGKRLRPHMVMKSCQILGGSTVIAIPAASAVEMIHNFTLVHDDIMDNDEMRHGVPTVHKKFGMPIAILAGDVLFSKAYQIISNAKLSNDAIVQLVSRLAKACVDVCEGQLLDVKMAEEKRIPTQNEYITMIGKKTAALFDVSCSMGAICATGNQKDISNLSNFGKNLGIAFQITDDLIGVMGDSKITKKPVGNDLREGKKSLPILMAIKLAKGEDRKVILKAFGNPKASKNELEKAVDVIRSLGIEEEVRRQALHYAETAKKSLSNYSGTAKTELIDLLDFVVKRSV